MVVLGSLIGCGLESAGGPDSEDHAIDLVDQTGNGPLQVSAAATVDKLNGLATIAVEIANPTGAAVTIRVRCTPIELDRKNGNTWQRIEDLRLCAPPDRTVVPARTTLSIEDVRQVDPGEYRVTIELVDGRTAHSPAFVIPAAR
jgi:hypothetical protein